MYTTSPPCVEGKFVYGLLFNARARCDSLKQAFSINALYSYLYGKPFRYLRSQCSYLYGKPFRYSRSLCSYLYGKPFRYLRSL